MMMMLTVLVVIVMGLIPMVDDEGDSDGDDFSTGSEEVGMIMAYSYYTQITMGRDTCE